MSGSSPHTRGALLKIVNLTCREGIIPAYAGSTFWMLGFVLVVGDHPRIRGEHREYFAMWVLTHGSSPHTRGALALLQRTLAQRRIIPAYAGSTPASPPASATRRDHPRIRGEHAERRGSALGFEGSSPHTRGARDETPGTRGRGRIIPAYAGSTDGRRGRPGGSRDHPRIRGEHRATMRTTR